MFIYPIYYHNLRNISTIYMYITRLALNEIFSPSNKKHREVGRAKDLPAPRYYWTSRSNPHDLSLQQYRWEKRKSCIIKALLSKLFLRIHTVWVKSIFQEISNLQVSKSATRYEALCVSKHKAL